MKAAALCALLLLAISLTACGSSSTPPAPTSQQQSTFAGTWAGEYSLAPSEDGSELLFFCRRFGQRIPCEWELHVFRDACFHGYKSNWLLHRRPERWPWVYSVLRWHFARRCRHRHQRIDFGAGFRGGRSARLLRQRNVGDGQWLAPGERHLAVRRDLRWIVRTVYTD